MRAFLHSVAILVSAWALPAAAGDVAVTGVHICCASCVRGVEHALKDVTGVKNVNADRKTKTIKFTAADADAAAAGIAALARAGFHGAARHGDAVLQFPDSGADAEAQAAQVRVSQVHLCCGACVRAVEEAVRKVAGVQKVAADRDNSAVLVSGESIRVSAVVKALNGAGFHARIEP